MKPWKQQKSMIDWNFLWYWICIHIQRRSVVECHVPIVFHRATRYDVHHVIMSSYVMRDVGQWCNVPYSNVMSSCHVISYRVLPLLRNVNLQKNHPMVREMKTNPWNQRLFTHLNIINMYYGGLLYIREVHKEDIIIGEWKCHVISSSVSLMVAMMWCASTCHRLASP